MPPVPIDVNAIDIVILIIIGIFAVGGLRRGFLLGLVDLVALVVALVIGARVGGALAGPLRERGVDPVLAGGASFVIVTVVSLTVIGLVGRVLLSPLRGVGTGTPLAWANSVLGLLPGAVRGLALAALLVFILAALPPEFGLQDQLVASRLAGPIARTARDALTAGLGWADIEPEQLIAPVPAAPRGRLTPTP